LKILIIDDEEDLRTILRFCLGRIGGMELAEASNGTEGLAKAFTEKPDAILLDIMMPGMDGTAVQAALRANPSLQSIPVIFLTAKATSNELDLYRNMGVAGILTKPFDPLTLAEKVRKILGGGS
jgi:CheY-like chemotaxis protein